MENDRACTFKFKDQSRQYFVLWDTALSGPTLPRLKHNQCFGFIMCIVLMVLCSTFPNSSPSEMKKKPPENPGYLFPASLVTQQLVWATVMPQKSNSIATASYCDCRFSLCLCGWGVFLLTCFPPVLLLQLGSEVDGRSPPPMRYSPLCWWLDSGGLVIREWKKQRWGEKSFDLFYVSFKLKPGTLGDRC